jgi:hypothetical protein
MEYTELNVYGVSIIKLLSLIRLTHQCGKMSLTLTAELLYFSILVMAEIAFSVGLIFSGERDSGSVIISTRYGMASPHAPCRQKYKESLQNQNHRHVILHACQTQIKHQPNMLKDSVFQILFHFTSYVWVISKSLCMILL